METVNPIVKYFFPVVVFLQYLGCDAYSHLRRTNVSSETTIEVLGEDCSDFDKDTYNGFYIPLDTGKLFVKKQDSNIDSLYVSKKPLIGLQYFKSVSKSFDSTGRPNIQVTFNESGKLLFKEYTAINIGTKIAVVVNDRLITAPIISGEIPNGQVEISGNFAQNEVDKMHMYLYRMIKCMTN